MKHTSVKLEYQPDFTLPTAQLVLDFWTSGRHGNPALSPEIACPEEFDGFVRGLLKDLKILAPRYRRWHTAQLRKRTLPRKKVLTRMVK